MRRSKVRLGDCRVRRLDRGLAPTGLSVAGLASPGSHPFGCVGVGAGPRRAGPVERKPYGQAISRLSELEREERRRQDRQRLQRAAQELLCSEGWARWVRVRAMFRSYSAGNCMLLALQCHERGLVPERVAGFRTWLKLGRCVRKGEKALRILAPVSVKERDAAGEETGKRRVFFKTAFVFELSQTEPLPGAELAGGASSRSLPAPRRGRPGRARR